MELMEKETNVLHSYFSLELMEKETNVLHSYFSLECELLHSHHRWLSSSLLKGFLEKQEGV